MPFECERHTAAIFDRGGRNRLGTIEPLSSVEWGRTRDDMSKGRIVTAQPTMRCLRLLREIAVNRHELVIFRDQERVWEGPVSLISRHADVFELEARDVMYYVYRTVAHAGYDSTDPDGSEPVVDRTFGMLVAELARKEALDPPINVVDHIQTVRATDTDTERKTLRVTLPYQMTVFDDMDSLAHTGGLDYTVLGRSIILSDTRVPIGQTVPMTEADFIGEVVVSSYGLDSSTRAITTGDEGMYGEAGGIDSYFGEWEIIEQMFDEDSTEPPTQNALDNAANYNLIGRPVPPPTVVRVPEGSRLNPQGVLSMKDLVPGVWVPVRATLAAEPVIQMQKLNEVKVTERPGEGEIISVTMGPAPQGLDPED